jgi:hypothetical protein
MDETVNKKRICEDPGATRNLDALEEMIEEITFQI